VLDPGRGRTKTGQLWAYACDDRPWGGTDPPGVAYVYAPDRRAERPIAHLAGFKGILQVDGYAGYLLSHDRPMSEVLAPTRKDIRHEFERGFVGMTEQQVSLEDLLAAREELIADIVGKMPEAHRKFLVSFERGEPDWPLLAVPGAAELPAIKWRQLNLDKLPADRRAALVKRLEEVLFG
jgi:hypothetical protein